MGALRYGPDVPAAVEVGAPEAADFLTIISKEPSVMHDAPIANETSRGPLRAALCALSVLLAPALGAAANASSTGTYVQHNLVSDGFISADHVDPNLRNPWGLVFGPNTPVWVANQGSLTSTLYDGLGTASSTVVTIPHDNEAPPVAGAVSVIPTLGTANQFMVTENGVSGPSLFLFGTLDGNIDGWAPSVDRTTPIIVVDQSLTGLGALFTGIALGNNGTTTFLYTADFGNSMILVFDTNFKQVTLPPGAFTDPDVPADYAPYNIRNIGGALYVVYAPRDRMPGDGRGLIDVFDTSGNLVKQFERGAHLNCPWAITLAPANFGRFSNDILVANTGTGKIAAFNPVTGAFDGFLTTILKNGNEKALQIDGLLGIEFGNGLLHQPTNTLFFTAGPFQHLHGLYGTIMPVAATN